MEALPSFLGDKDVVVDVPGLGKVKLEDFFGIFLLKPSSSGHAGPGLWWHVVCHRGSRAGNRKKTAKSSLSKVGLKLEPEHGKKIAKLGEMIKVASHRTLDIYSLPR